ncbi:MAG: universal stress protein, partial [Planctomycetota bacterium]
MAQSKILVSVSTPWASDKLFNTIRDLADRLNASVIVAHVAKTTEDDDTDDDTKLRSHQTLSTLTTRLVEANIPAQGLLLYGDDVARAILNAAQDQEATLILLGLSAKGRLKRFLAGDIPQQVLKNAQVPVLVFPPDWAGKVETAFRQPVSSFGATGVTMLPVLPLQCDG